MPEQGNNWIGAAQDFGKLLAPLDPAERKRALEILRMTIASAAPADKLKEKAPIRTLGDYLDNPPPKPPELVTPRFLARGSVTATIARAGVGKTSLHLNRLIPWSLGRPMFDSVRTAFVPIQPLRILIIENEGAGGLFHEKIQTMMQTAGDRFSDEDRAKVRENILIWGEGGYAGVKLDDDKWLRLIESGIEEWKPDVLLMEPWARLHDKNENDNSEMNQMGSVVEALAAKHGIAIMLAHHEKKSQGLTIEELMDRSRGATALEGFTGYMEFFQRARGNQFRELLAAKNRYGQLPLPLRMQWRVDNSGWYDYVPTEAGIAEILALLDPLEPRYTVELAQELHDSRPDNDGMEIQAKDKNHVRNLLNRAAEEGKVQKLPMTKESGGNGWLLKSTDEDDTPQGPTF